MKKRLLCLALVAITLFIGISVTACGRDDDSGNNGDSIDGKYYGCGFYLQSDSGDEVGFIELKDGKCTISLDSTAREHDFTVDGNYITVSANSESADFRHGMAGIINNGVILTVCDGTFVMYCKEGKTPQDLFKNTSGIEGKYLMYNNGLYNQSAAIAIVGNTFVMYKRVGTVSKNNNNMLKFTTTFVDKQGFDFDTDALTELNFNIIENNTLDLNYVYSDIEGDQYEVHECYCKLGYSEDGTAITGEYLVTLAPNGGVVHLILPLQTLTVKGKVYLSVSYRSVYRRGYECTGFNTKADGSGTEYYEGIEINEDTVFYAVWEDTRNE